MNAAEEEVHPLEDPCTDRLSQTPQAFSPRSVLKMTLAGSESTENDLSAEKQQIANNNNNSNNSNGNAAADGEDEPVQDQEYAAELEFEDLCDDPGTEDCSPRTPVEGTGDKQRERHSLDGYHNTRKGDRPPRPTRRWSQVHEERRGSAGSAGVDNGEAGDELKRARRRAASRANQPIRKALLESSQSQSERVLDAGDAYSFRHVARENMKQRRLRHIDQQVDRFLLREMLSNNAKRLTVAWRDNPQWKWSDILEEVNQREFNNGSDEASVESVDSVDSAGSAFEVEGSPLRQPAAKGFLDRVRRESRVISNSSGHAFLDLPRELLGASQRPRLLNWSNSWNARQASRLVEHIIIVGPSPEDVEAMQTDSALLTPQVLYKYPYERQLCAEAIGIFCFPNDCEVTVSADTPHPDVNFEAFQERLFCPTSSWSTDDEDAKAFGQPFVFLLSGVSALGADTPDTLYGVCLTIHRRVRRSDGRCVTVPYCVCILAEMPYLSFYFAVLARFASTRVFRPATPFFTDDQRKLANFDEVVCKLDEIAAKLYRHPAPRPGGNLELLLALGSSRQELCMKRPLNTDLVDDQHFFMGRWALPSLLKHISVDHLLLILGCCLTEMRVVFVADDLNVLSTCIFSLLLLLQPLKWAGPVIVTLPHTLSAYLESPVPLILGVQELPEYFELEPGLVLIYPSTNEVKLHAADVRSSHTLILPHASKVCHELKPFVDQILLKPRLSRAPSPSTACQDRSPTLGTIPQLDIDRADDTANEVEDEAESDIYERQSCELRRVFSSSRQVVNVDTPNDAIWEAIQGFIQCLANHVQGFVDSAVDVVKSQLESGGHRRSASRDSDSRSASSIAASALLQNQTTIHRQIRERYGDAGVMFLHKMMETQMFSNFVDRNRRRPASSVDGSSVKTRESDSAGIGERTYSMMSMGQAQGDHPVQALFVMLLSGTDPERTEDVDSATHTATRSRSDTVDESVDEVIERYTDVPWCNGQCKGMADTEWCTTVCLEVWEQRALLARNQVEVLSIIERNKSTLPSAPIRTSDGAFVKLNPSLPPKKHKRETASQFTKRLRTFSAHNRCLSDGVLCIPDDALYSSLAAPALETATATEGAAKKVPQHKQALRAMASLYNKRSRKREHVLRLESAQIITHFLRWAAIRQKWSNIQEARSMPQHISGRAEVAAIVDSLTPRTDASGSTITASPPRATDPVALKPEQFMNRPTSPSERQLSTHDPLPSGRQSPRLSKSFSYHPGTGSSSWFRGGDQTNDDTKSQVSNEPFSYWRRWGAPSAAPERFDSISMEESSIYGVDDLENVTSVPSLTELQRNLLHDLSDRLERGIFITKHGRSGRPHQRLLGGNKALTKLFWRDYGDVPRRTTFNRRKSEEDRIVYISDIEDIRTGIDSEVMQRALHKGFVTQQNGDHVVIIVTDIRTLDMEVPSDEDRDILLNGLKILIEHRAQTPHTM